jgi:hypothetical protein
MEIRMSALDVIAFDADAAEGVIRRVDPNNTAAFHLRFVEALPTMTGQI